MAACSSRGNGRITATRRAHPDPRWRHRWRHDRRRLRRRRRLTDAAKAPTRGPTQHLETEGDGSDAAGSVDPCTTARVLRDLRGLRGRRGADRQLEGRDQPRRRDDRGPETPSTFDGQKAAKFTTLPVELRQGKTAYIKLNAPNVFPVPGNRTTGRMMTWLQSAPAMSVHWTFIQAGGVVAGPELSARSTATAASSR